MWKNIAVHDDWRKTGDGEIRAELVGRYLSSNGMSTYRAELDENGFAKITRINDDHVVFSMQVEGLIELAKNCLDKKIPVLMYIKDKDI